ncbi:MAG: rhamnulose-1-phosphate aldolase [Bacteroidaceae bacterium]|nr:rhamnulose-1-phosphate aldolase [Bacteroidaceae bacterium]MBP9637867.1 rhamnulose-1-phosphate aldolase [Bacteroidaceae bacterium]
MESILTYNAPLTDKIADIAEVAGYLWERGWAERNGGNISVNITEHMTAEAATLPAIRTVQLPATFTALASNYFFVTGTGRRMRYVSSSPMDNGAIIRINAAGDAYDIIADQDVAPTSELPSHLSMHNYMRGVKKQNTKVVCHTHPTDLIALTHIKQFLVPGVLGRMLWSMIPETRIIVPRGVGIVPYNVPGTMELANATIAQLATHDVVMWEKHGCLAVGEDVIETFDMIDTLSKSAQIYFYAKQAGFEPEGMADAELDELVPIFGLPTE